MTSRHVSYPPRNAMTVMRVNAAVRVPTVCPVSRHRVARSHRGAVRARAEDDRVTIGETSTQRENREVLDAFFVGKSLAETLLERAGRVFADALSEVSAFDAANREQIRLLQDEVLGKAREESQRTKLQDDGMR